MEAIKLVNCEKGLDTPAGLKAHSTRGMSTSWALFRGMTLEDICAVVIWSTVHTFGRYYILEVTAPSLAQVVLNVRTSLDHPSIVVVKGFVWMRLIALALLVRGCLGYALWGPKLVGSGEVISQCAL